MTGKKSSKGQCLCGKVQIKAQAIDLNMGACHCNMCQKWTAGPFLAVDCGEDVEILGKENVKFYDSSSWAQRAFCSECGTSLFYYLKGKNQYIVSAALFSDLNLIFHHQIFIDKKPSCYNFVENTINMTEAEVFANVNS